MGGFISVERLSLGPWQAFERAIERLLTHLGFSDVDLVGRVGDEGADVVGTYRGVVWAAQAKFRSNGVLIGPEPIDEVTVALDRYGAKTAVVATNTGFSASSVAAAAKRAADLGVPFRLWDAEWLLSRFRQLPEYAPARSDPRPYQTAAITAINDSILEGNGTGLLLMATGLGKTRVAAAIIEQWLIDHPDDECLVIVPSLPLVSQFERALWPYLPKWASTHVMTGSEKPSFEGGVVIATAQSMVRQAGDHEGRFGLVIIDEAHHAPADGYQHIVSMLAPRYLLGLTATPWRGDERQLDETFGPPTHAVSIVEGMQAGYLAQVDYRMLLDDIDWDWVHQQVDAVVSVKELNRRLFIKERDEAVVAKIGEHIGRLHDPRCVIFCRSIEHAETITRLLKADGLRARCLHSKLDKKEATKFLHDFRIGAVTTLVTVDMLNEGIDVPDVNLIVFLRVTHSRRIFVQQLGRGLRLSPGKRSILVLDFVSDIRRLTAALDLNRSAASYAAEASQAVYYPTGNIVQFSNDATLSFFKEYLADIAELESEDESAVLKFPAAL